MPHQNRLWAYAKLTAPKPALWLLLNRLCIGTKPVFSFWINISTVSEVRFDCQGLGLEARNEASILVFDTKPVLYRPVLDQIQFCSFDRGCKTCLDTKPVLDLGRFCSLTDGFPITTHIHMHIFTNTFYQEHILSRQRGVALWIYDYDCINITEDRWGNIFSFHSSWQLAAWY